MKKQVKDLALEEVIKICNSQCGVCWYCPFYKITGNSCLIRKEPYLWNEYSEDEIEVEEDAN